MSKQQYEVVDAVDYPARVRQKLHESKTECREEDSTGLAFSSSGEISSFGISSVMFSAPDPHKDIGLREQALRRMSEKQPLQFAVRKITSTKEGHVPMKTSHFLATTLFLAFQLSPCLVAAAPQMTPQKEQQAAISASGLTNEDVTVLLKSGLTTEIVIAKINSSACDFNTSTTALQDLKTSGVPDPVILAMVQASKGVSRLASAQPSAQSTQAQFQPAQPTQTPSKGCMAVRPIGSHALRNYMLLGVAGVLISHQQYQVVDVIDYPARVAQKFHGNDLQTIQSSGTRVVLLEKHYTAEELHKACH